MADERYVIDIILNARDDISRAVAQATASLAGLDAAADKSSKRSEKLGDVFDQNERRFRRYANLIDDVSGKLKDQASKVDVFGESMRRNDQRLKTSQDQFKELNDEVRQTQGHLKGAETEVGNLNHKLRDLEQQQQGVKKGHKNFVELAQAIENTEKKLESAEKRLGTLTGKFDDQTKRLREYGSELNRSNKAREEGIQLIERNQRALERETQQYDRNLKKLAETRDVLSKAKQRGVDPMGFNELSKDADKAERDVRGSLTRMKELAREQVTVKFGGDLDELERDAKEAEAIKAAIGRDIEINVDMDMSAMLAKSAAIEAAKAAVGKDVEIKVDVDGAGTAVAQLAAFQSAVSANRNSVAAFDNQLRGLLAFGVLGAFQPLLSSVLALGGGLVQLAGSATMAGAAIGAGLTSGIAQAMPMVGLMVAAISRVAAVMEAVQQFDLMKKQESAAAQQGTTDDTSQVNSLANAHDALAGAQQGVVDAQRRLRDSQVELTRARFDARRELQDLIMAETEAQLAAEGAALSQEEAQKRLQQSVLTGDISGLARAQLGVDEAAVAKRRADAEAARASQDLRLQRSGSPNRPDTGVEDAQKNIEEAKRGIEDAQQSVEQAKRGIETAQASAAKAGDDLTAAGANLHFFLSRLTEAEKGLYDAIINIRKTFNQNIRPLTDNLIESFTVAVKRVDGILSNPQFLKSATRLSEQMAQSINKVTREFTSPKWVKFWEEMMGEAGKNLKPITTQFLQLANVFRRIADAAQPVFRRIVSLIGDAVTDFSKWVGHGKQLRDFMDEAQKHMVGWFQLGRAVLRLFGELVSSGAKGGLGLVRDFTKAINEASEWIDSHGKKMDRFWKGTGTVLKEIGKVVLALGDEILKSFNPKSVQALGGLIRKVLLPAFGDAIRTLGKFLIILEGIFKNKAAAELAQIAIAATIFAKVSGTLIHMVTGLFAGLSKIVTIGSKVSGFLTRTSPFLAQMAANAGGLGRALVAMLGPWAAVAAAVVFLLNKAGRLDDVWNAIKETFQDFVDLVKPAFEDLKDSVEELVGGLTGGGSLDDVLKSLGNILADVLIPAIKIFGNLLGGAVAFSIARIAGSIKFLTGLIKGIIEIVKAVGNIFRDIFAGIKDYIGGWVSFFDDLIHGRFDQLWGDIKQIITSPFRTAWNVIKDIFGGVVGFFSNLVEGIGGAISSVASVFSAPFEAAVDVVKGIINWMIENVLNKIPGITIDLIGGEPEQAPKKSKGRTGPMTTGAHTGFARGGRVGMALGGDVLNAAKSINPFVPTIVGGAGDLIEAVTDFDMGGLPKWMSGLGDWIKDSVIDLIKDMPGNVFEGAKDLVGGAADAVSGLFKATGGRASGSGGIDNIPAWLTRGEFVVTPSGEHILEQMTGVPGVLNWLGKVQSRATGFASGGRVGFAAGGRAKGGSGGGPSAVDAGPLLEELLSVIDSFGGNATRAWNTIWKTITKTMDDAIDDLVKNADKGFEKMRKSTIDSMRGMARGIKQQMNEAERTLKSGMADILEQTNKALKAFGVDSISLTAHQEKGGKGKAVGGFIGMPGERGADAIPAYLGRGEAVLNWAHQKMVEPALQRMYGFGLNGMFKGTRAMHGKGVPGGFATGGRMVEVPTDPDASADPNDSVNQAIVGAVAAWLKKYHADITAGYDPGGGHVSPGHNVTGTATDVVPIGGWGGASQALFEAGLRSLTGAGYTVYYDGSNGTTQWDGHGPPAAAGDNAHAHIEWSSSDQELKNMVFDAHLKAIKILGEDGAVKDMVQGAMDKIGDAAQKFLDKQGANHVSDADLKGIKGGDIPDAIAEIGRRLNAPREAILAAYEAAIVESGDPNLQTNPDYGDSTSQGIFQLLSTTAAGMGLDPLDVPAVIEAFYTKGFWGKGGAIELAKQGMSAGDIAQNVEGSAFPERYAQVEDRARAFMQQEGFAKGGFVHADDVGEEFATGGVVGKRTMKGSAIPIIAHAGEWVLNQGQQLRLAGALGSTLSGLQSLLGFGGPSGKMGFADGGEVNDWLPKFFSQFAQHFGREFRHMFGEDPSFATKLYGAFAPIIGDLYFGIRQFVASVADFGKTSKDFKDDVARLQDQNDHRPRGRGNTTEQSAVERATSTLRGLETFISHAGQLFSASGKDLEDSVRKFFDGIAGDGGLLDQMGEAFDNLVVVMSTRLNQAIVRTNRRGRVLGRDLQPGQIIDNELTDLERQLRFLLGEKGVLKESIEQAKKALSKARKWTDAEAIEDAQKDLDKAIKAGNDKAIEEARKAMKEAKQRGNDAAEEAAKTALQNLLDRQRDLNAQIADQQVSVLDKIEEKLQQESDQIQQRADSALSGYDKKTKKFGADIRLQIAEALGFLDQLPALAARSIEILTAQQGDLKKLLAKAIKRGDMELARDLESQIADLQVQITQATVDMVTAAADEVNRQADRRNVGTDFWNRILDVQAGLGNELGAEQARGGVIQAQRGGITQQIAGLQAVLASAIAQGLGEGITGPLEDQIIDLQAQLAENTLALYENQAAIIQARQTLIERGLDMRNAIIGFANTMADVKEGFGDTVGAAQDRTGLIQAQRGNLQQQIADITGLLNEALFRGLGAEVIDPLRIQLIDLNGQLQENSLALYQNNIAIIDAMKTEVEENRTMRSSFLDLHGVMADVKEAFGDQIGAERQRGGLLQNQGALLQSQLSNYRELLAQAVEQGLDADVTDPLKQKINELMGEIEQNKIAIYENTIAQLAAVQAEKEREFAREDSLANLAQRLADVRGAFGDTVGSAQATGGLLESRRDALAARLIQYQQLLAEAMAQGMHFAVTDPLQETINDLMGQIEENSLAIYENTIAQRDAAIALIQNRQDFRGGILDQLGGLLDQLGNLSGTPNIALMISIMQRAIEALTSTGMALRDQMNEFVQSNLGALPANAQAILSTLGGLHGEDFVTAIMGLDLDSIVDSLGGPASPLAQQFQALLQAIIDNESALNQNTEELQNLQDERHMQQFTSTAWQWFRQAIFTGMGSLLPQYGQGTPYGQDVPEMALGGDVMAEGLHYLHQGEYVVPERMAAAARMLMGAGSLAGSLSSGSMAGADMYSLLASGASGTMGGGLAQAAGVNSANEMRQLKEAMLKRTQTIETHIHGRESNDDAYLAQSIAFRSKIPTS